jgi:hypothetical protein
MTERLLRRLAIPIALLGVGALPATGRADISFDLGNTTTTTNIGAFVANTDTTATGSELGTGPALIEVVTDSALTVPAQGQARIEAASPDDLFLQVDFDPAGAVPGFFAIELNPMITPGSGATGTFQLVATDNMGAVTTSPTFDYGAGENRVFALATAGQDIRSLSLNVLTGPGFLDIRQIRVTPVPEPGSLALVGLGLAALGLVGLRRATRTTPSSSGTPGAAARGDRADVATG